MEMMDGSIGNRIKLARLELGLSQVELAQAANVSQPTVANWENDSHVPRQGALDKLSEILAKPANWIRIGGNGQIDLSNSSEGYLLRPIRHVPISPWPSVHNIQNGMLIPEAAKDYIALSISPERPFALIANDPAMAAHFPVGVAIIFSADVLTLVNDKCYLFEHDGDIILRRWQSAPDRLEALPNQSAVDATFLDTPPKPLARAIMSVRRH